MPFAFVVGPGAGRLVDTANDLGAEFLPGVEAYEIVTCSQGAALVVGSEPENLRPDSKREDLAIALEDGLQATAGC